MVGRAEWTTTGQGGKNVSDKVSLDLEKEFTKLQTALDENTPVLLATHKDHQQIKYQLNKKNN